MNHGERRRLFPQIDKRLATGRIARTLRRSHRIGDLTLLPSWLRTGVRSRCS